jgi:Family of unknown function (DUF5761)
MAMANGRVDLLPGENGVPFYLFAAPPGGDKAAAADAYKNIELNATGELFMSPMNVDALQDAIRYQVYVRSAGLHTIGRQSDLELSTIMRALHLQHGRNTTGPGGAPDLEEVRRLNGIVIEYSVGRIVSEIGIYQQYRRDISSLPVPMARGEFSSSKGQRSSTQRVEF